MIFVTVGTQLAFDRMVGAVDTWAAHCGEEVVAQVGPTDRIFANLRQRDFLDPVEFDRAFEEADLVIAHAGMGSILSALSFGQRLIIVPRKAVLGEHRNDHQMATAKRFAGRKGVDVVWQESELGQTISRVLDEGRGKKSEGYIARTAPEDFLLRLSALISG